jgi:wyosine [tRNA(Phe)-imidazoG37] synthetase (radical SAM superfamily)
MSILFQEIVFGPVRSRRLGVSLGVNVLPLNTKECTFNCVYCECGWTLPQKGESAGFHAREEIREALRQRCGELKAAGAIPDAITFAGNGEPTMHPEFPGIIDDTLAIRDEYFPEARVVVLSNSTTAGKPAILAALKKVDPIMKLDAGSDACMRLINKPMMKINMDEIVEHLTAFQGRLTIQSLFMRAEINGKWVDNTTEEEVAKWINHLKVIMPHTVMIYPIDREAPDKNISKVDVATLEQIAERIRALGIETKVYA